MFFIAKMRHDFSDNPIVTIISKPVGKVFIWSLWKNPEAQAVPRRQVLTFSHCSAAIML